MISKKSKKQEEETKYLVESINQLQAEEKLNREQKKAENMPLRKTSLTFIVLSASALVASALINSYILTFIGLALIFWGALFLFAKPVRYTKSSLLTTTAISTYVTVDRIVKDLKFRGRSYYIPPSLKVSCQEYSKGLKDPLVFIAADSRGIPPIKEVVENKFLLKNPNGIFITPPGLGLLKQFENELKEDVSKIKLTELCGILPALIVDHLQLAKNVKIQARDSHFYLKISNSAYKDLYITKEFKSIHSLGCPLVSAIACAIAKTLVKTVTIEGQHVSNDKQTIEVWYRIIE